VIAALEVDDGFVAPGPEEDPQASLRRYCTERLARYKVPDRFVFCDPLPRNAMGKVRRDLLAEQLG
jgi:acyl-CoA synthetase (AMP-forming)/AMP-acid ligase II